MADFRTHLVGGILAGGAAAAAAAWFGWTELWRLPLVGLVGTIGGLAPDIDHDTSRPAKILFRLAAITIPTALVWRVGWLHVVAERAVLSWLLLAVLVRWPASWIFQHLTTHRGIFHSVPAVGIFGASCFLLAGRHARDVEHQLAFGLAGALGYLTHLVLDELWSVDFNGVTIKSKKSAGTALALHGGGLPSTAAAYGLLAVLGALVWQGLEGLVPEDLWSAWGGDGFVAQLLQTVTTLQILFSAWLEELAARA